MKQFNTYLLLMLLLVAGAASAEQQPYAEFEVPSLKMKLSDDGTGIIKKVTCGGCDYSFAKITKNTQAYVNGVNVDLFRARERAGKPVFIQFVRSTGEVMAIRWSE
jgi:hypothetical protein